MTLHIFPDQDGQFNLQDSNITSYSTLVVERPTASGLNMKMGFSSAARASGQSVSSTALPSQQQSQIPSPLLSAGHGPPMFRSVVAPRKAAVSLNKNHEGEDDGNKEGREARFSVHWPDVHRVDRCNGQRRTSL